MSKIFKNLFDKIPTPVKEAVKEGLRVLVLGIMSWLLTEGVIDMILTAVVGAHLDATTKLYISGILTTGLRSVDKWLHETGKIEEKKTGEDSIKTDGLVRF